ncbi:MAG TPA: Hsp20/alpha crystallin family protein [Verrucomicrobiae bacterium]|nr:Hsp20/alpha crystallin family protein [Verrucomicrobiae bacterium]
MLLTRYSNPQLNQWGAFEPLRRFQNDIERLFNSDQPAERNWLPALEVNEDKDKFLVTVELPGVNTADVKVTLEDDVLAISGERKYVGTAQSELRLSERYYGKFERSVRLPAPVQANHVTATGKDGVLTITLPKVEEARPREIKIEAAS